MSKIPWTNETWNPIIGCSKISEGCQNCYAEKMAIRLAAMGQETYQEVVTKRSWKGKALFVESQIEKPFQWKQGRMIFVCSMSDLFHESIPFEWIDEVFNTIMFNLHHTFQILTKRPERMKEYFLSERTWMKIAKTYPLPNVWIGSTCENQARANERIPILLQIPAAKRYVSCEPMLGPIDFYDIVISGEYYNALRGFGDISGSLGYTGPKLDWVICGCESGPKRRPFDFDWAVSLRDQCVEANVPFFFKQMYDGNKKISLPPIDWKVWDQIPER